LGDFQIILEQNTRMGSVLPFKLKSPPSPIVIRRRLINSVLLSAGSITLVKVMD
jgi:hypothetical protein